MNKNKLFTVIFVNIVVISILVAWFRWHTDTQIQEAHHEWQANAKKSKIDKQVEEAGFLFTQAMKAYQEHKPQAYLAQNALFALLDHDVINEPRADVLSRVKQLVDTRLIDLAAYNYMGHTALMLASLFSQDSSLVRFLLESGVSPNQYDLAGNYTPLAVASLHSYENVKILLSYEADPNAPLRMHLEKNAKRRGSNVIAELIFNLKMKLGFGAFNNLKEVLESNLKIVNLLLAYGANPTMTDKEDKSVLDYLKEMQQFFIHREYEPELEKRGLEPLTDAQRDTILQWLDQVHAMLESRSHVTVRH